MVEKNGIIASGHDPFDPIARHYDDMMEHVDYDRWFRIGLTLAELLPRPVRHLDAGCGTGLLMRHFEGAGWQSFGLDLSGAMLRAARKRHPSLRLAQADLCALPFSGCFNFITCLFDSMNFLLHEDQLRQALRECRNALEPGGILYFDVVTERMITSHFNNASWSENHGKFRSAWISNYDFDACLCETRVRINSGAESITYERIYSISTLREALEQAGLSLLALRDHATWKAPTARTTRLDFIAVNGALSVDRKVFDRRDVEIRRIVGG